MTELWESEGVGHDRKTAANRAYFRGAPPVFSARTAKRAALWDAGAPKYELVPVGPANVIASAGAQSQPGVIASEAVRAGSRGCTCVHPSRENGRASVRALQSRVRRGAPRDCLSEQIDQADATDHFRFGWSRIGRGLPVGVVLRRLAFFEGFPLLRRLLLNLRLAERDAGLCQHFA